MHIIIVGAGEAGHYLAQILIEENHDVCVIEQDEKRARQLDEKLDAQVIHGTGTSRESLFRAGIHKADLLAAVTQVDEVNLIAAMTAERLKPGCRTVARVREVRYMEGTDALDASEFGVDMVVGPEQAVADQIVNLLQYGGPGQMVSVAGRQDGAVGTARESALGLRLRHRGGTGRGATESVSAGGHSRRRGATHSRPRGSLRDRRTCRRTLCAGTDQPFPNAGRLGRPAHRAGSPHRRGGPSAITLPANCSASSST